MTSRACLALRAVIFDLDGTLVDSAPDLACAANRMLCALGMPERDIALISTFIGKGVPALVERALCGRLDATADPALLARALPLFERFYEEESGRRTRLYPTVTRGLEALAREGLRLACVTNKPERPARALLERMGLAHFFAMLVGGDTLERKKPDAMPFLHVCERLGILPSEALVVGDSAYDVLGARAAGCPVVCVAYGYNEGRPVETLASDAVVATIEEAARIVMASRGAHTAGVAA